MSNVLVGFEVGTGNPVTVPIAHIAVTGQTQMSGKTTALEALVGRSGVTALTFITKRGEAAFEDGNRVTPYFRDRADWQFVTSIIDATLQEKNKFLRPWIMKICRTTRTLAEVQQRVREALRTAKGINEGVYTQLDAYLDLIVPEIGRARLATALRLEPGLNVMDVSGFDAPMQMLFIQSAIDHINGFQRDTVMVVPEAWEFIPQGGGSPVKASAVALVRKGAALHNFIWVDSQDMAGVDKTILRGCTVWLVGVQREANEIKRNLANIPRGIATPKAADVALLERGQFFVCWGRHCVKTYVMPTWINEVYAVAVARGERVPPPRPNMRDDDDMGKAEANELREENRSLRARVGELEKLLSAAPALAQEPLAEGRSNLGGRRTPMAGAERPAPPAPFSPSQPALDMDAIYTEVKRRAAADPGVLALLRSQPEIEVTVTRSRIQMTDDTLQGRLAGLIAGGFFDDGTTASAAHTELQRLGRGSAKPNVYRECDKLAALGFLTKEPNGYRSVPGMKINVVER